MQPIKICDNQKCVACEACANACNLGCIEMIQDKRGFYAPTIDYDKCVGCGKCVKACPNNYTYTLKRLCEPKSYACYSKEDEIVKSTSGGLFYYFGKKIIKEGGCVYGAVWNEDWTVSIIRADAIDALKKMRGSKYIQSRMHDNYRKVRQDLENGRMVLFSGVPCQVAGLYSYLGRDYDNLFTIDIICRGGLSENAFKGFCEYIENKNCSKLKYYNAREKIMAWDPWFLGTQEMMKFENDKIIKYDPLNSIFQQKVFCTNNGFKEACYLCKFNGFPRFGDVTLGDYAGLGVLEKCSLYNKDGISLMTVNSEKGEALFEKYKSSIEWVERSIWESIYFNLNIWKASIKGKNRIEFLLALENDELPKWIDKIINDKKEHIIVKIKNIIIKLFGKKNVLRIIFYKRKICGFFPDSIPSNKILDNNN